MRGSNKPNVLANRPVQRSNSASRIVKSYSSVVKDNISKPLPSKRPIDNQENVSEAPTKRPTLQTSLLKSGVPNARRASVCSEISNSPPYVSSPTDSMVSACSSSASDPSPPSLSEALISDSELDRQMKGLRNNLKIWGQAQSLTSEELRNDRPEMKTRLVHKNASIIYLKSLLLNGAIRSTRSEAQAQIAESAIRQATEKSSELSKNIELHRKLQGANARIAALERELEEYQGGSANIGAETTSKIADLEAQLAEANASTDRLVAEQRQALVAQLETARKQANTIAEELKNTVRSRDALREEFEEAQATWKADFGEVTERLQKTTAALRSAADEIRSITVAKAESEEFAARELNNLEEKNFSLQAEVEKWKKKWEICDHRRAKLIDDVLTLKGGIRVFVRVRPPLPSEINGNDAANLTDPLFLFPAADESDLEDNLETLVLQERPGAGTGGYGTALEGKTHRFRFQRTFAPTVSQVEIFEDEVSTLVESVIQGKRVCVFAYGQTGSGKTYTMEGNPKAGDEHRGLIPRSVDFVFERMAILEARGWCFSVTAEMVEIYNETLRDLLVNSQKQKSLSIKVRKDETVTVDGLSVHNVTSPMDVMKLLQIAAQNRSVGSTAMNSQSSRSHSIFTLRIHATHKESAQSRSGVLNLVDLAGSERLAKSGAAADAKLLKETQNINSSLSMLLTVIKALKDKASHVPYRNSKLTHLLKDSLGGGSKTLLISNLNPLHSNAQESLCTLRFAENVSKISK